MTSRVLAILCVVWSFAPAPVAHAQDTPSEPDANARIRLGPLALSPTVALINAGVDTNVFNESDPLNPKSDFTMTFEPGADVWLRFGRSWFSANIKEDLVYYKKYSSQRTANNFETVGFTLPLNRLTVKAGAKYANASDRPGYEIAERVHHIDTGINGGVELRVLSKTFVGVRADRTTYAYDKSLDYFGVDLAEAFNRTATTGGVTIRHQLTPLTALTLDASREQDRFDIDHTRDSNSTLVMAGVLFDPFALIKGSAKVGYRDFTGLDPALPSFRGTTAAVDLSYVAMGSTKIAVQGMRDVQYSFDINQPYYVQSAISGSVAQQVYGPLDVVARAGVARLSYQTRSGAVVAYPDRADNVRTYGGGIGYHIGRDTRVGIDVNAQRRTSPNPLWNYHGLVIGMSVTYGY